MPPSAFYRGLESLPAIAIGTLPFGVVLGVVALQAGYGLGDLIVNSMLIFAGAAQFTLIHLMDQGSLWPVAAATAAVINMRFLLYSFSLSQHWSELSRRKRLAMAFFMTDQAYAISLRGYQLTAMNNIEKTWYFSGFAVGFYITWLASTTLGYLLGQALPEQWDLKFAMPLVFLTLCLGLVQRPSQLISAAIAGILSLLLSGLPHNLGFLLAVIIAIGTGVLLSLRWDDKHYPNQSMPNI